MCTKLNKNVSISGLWVIISYVYVLNSFQESLPPPSKIDKEFFKKVRETTNINSILVQIRKWKQEQKYSIPLRKYQSLDLFAKLPTYFVLQFHFKLLEGCNFLCCFTNSITCPTALSLEL